MGNLYRDIGDYETAMEYYREAENHALSNHLEFFAEAEINKAIGILYSLRGQYDSSLYYLQRAKGLYGRRNRDIQIAIGETYLLQKRYREALALFLPLLKNFRTANDVPLLMKTLHDLGKVYGALQQNGAALNYGKELLIIAQQKNTKQYIRDAAQLLSTIYAVKKQFDSAYKYHQLYAALKDSIETKQYLFRLARNKDEAESLKMNAEIKLLNKDKQIQQQQLDKESFARKILIGSILGLLLLSIIIVRVIMLKRKNEAHRRELAENELEIEKLENEKTKAELKQQATELEMQALRAQMNPHFIFNSLNSIDLFILQNDKAQASKYLTKFSRLIRIILTSSANASVSLAEDIEALQLYLELERVRCDKKFSFEIKYDPVIDTDFIQVPPMLLQPFAENAIWHGLMNKEGEGHLCININQEESTVICTIIDDGIGRKKAAELANKSGKHKSMGMKITESRISMMQKMNDGRSIVIRDLVDADGNAAGTEVVLKIPVAQI